MYNNINFFKKAQSLLGQSLMIDHISNIIGLSLMEDHKVYQS